jgi:hypothetical protein
MIFRTVWQHESVFQRPSDTSRLGYLLSVFAIYGAWVSSYVRGCSHGAVSPCESGHAMSASTQRGGYNKTKQLPAWEASFLAAGFHLHFAKHFARKKMIFLFTI